MKTSRSISLLFILPLVAFTLTSSSSVSAETDEEYWRKRQQEAQIIARASYVPDPFSVTNSFNAAVNKVMSKNNTEGRRGLGSGSDSDSDSVLGLMKGSCKATNPIDRCWRCRADWAENRQRLAGCAKGFGRKAYGGGKKSKIYVVTDSSDENLQNPKPGTLRWGVIQDDPLWITFAEDMVITLQQELIVASWKTIDGRGAKVEIAHGAGITIQYVTNVLIHGIHIHDIVVGSGGTIRDSLKHLGLRTQSDGDAISIFGSSNVWIDHLSLARSYDGLIDAIESSTAITISNCYLTEHNEAMLFGANDHNQNDSVMQITVAFNHFGKKLTQRLPRARFGFVHIVNNDYTEWEMYAVGGSAHPTIISQGNRYRAPDNPFAKEVTKRDYAAEWQWKSWNWTSEGDVFDNGAYFVASGTDRSIDLTKNFSRFDVFRAKPGSFVTRLTRYAGALDCKVGEPC